MDPTFPLLRLPDNAIITVLKNLRLGQLFDFSLISSKTKNFVTSSGFRARNVDINIFSRPIYVTVYTQTSQLTFAFYNDQNRIDMNRPIAAGFEYEYTKIRSSTLFNFSDWMNHIRTIFCYTSPPNICFYGCAQYEIELLRETIGNVNDLYVSSLLTDVMSREVLKEFNTPNKLVLDNNPFEEVSEIQQIFIQNFKTIVFYDFFSLDDMLLINIERANLYHPISQKQFNQFLKHWIRGSNPRLQHMLLIIDRADFVNGEVYLNGIRCTAMKEEANQDICRKHGLLKGGMVQIRRKDGTPAVIATKFLDDRLYIHLIVLH
ncbi:hypothetical protein CRE_29297 [Caenorhabditis remanei]|uniref:F-box domain-containing protein n=1 Tax=Caenorhabditis remanei TaxID=31234 RepID=E3MXY7_CAERE|nr:hypothetical protein CRE_29297 [Caenorhabditis remanei]